MTDDTSYRQHAAADTKSVKLKRNINDSTYSHLPISGHFILAVTFTLSLVSISYRERTVLALAVTPNRSKRSFDDVFISKRLYFKLK